MICQRLCGTTARSRRKGSLVLPPSTHCVTTPSRPSLRSLMKKKCAIEEEGLARLTAFDPLRDHAFASFAAQLDEEKVRDRVVGECESRDAGGRAAGETKEIGRAHV